MKRTAPPGALGVAAGAEVAAVSDATGPERAWRGLPARSYGLTERCARLDRERVRADVLGREGHRLLAERIARLPAIVGDAARDANAPEASRWSTIFLASALSLYAVLPSAFTWVTSNLMPSGPNVPSTNASVVASAQYVQ